MPVLAERPAEAPRRATASVPVRVLAALTALAAVAAVFLGVRWGFALTDDGLALAGAREAVLTDAKQAAINLNTLDHTNVDAGLDLWEQSSTGAVLEEFRANREQYAQFVAESQRTTEASVTDAAVAQLDDRAGTATVLVGLDVVVRPPDAEPVVTRQRLELEMARTGHGWKVSGLDPVRAPGAGGGSTE
jgi:Mce-associated membrane protein